MMDKNLLFVCLGNICRSPAAEEIMRQKLKEAGVEKINTDSAGLYGGHAGDLPDTRMRAHAARRGYKLTHRSRVVSPEDFRQATLILAMDDRNYDALRAMAPDPESVRKIRRIADYCTRLPVGYVPDPYYGGSEGFEQVLDILEDACDGLLKQLTEEE